MYPKYIDINALIKRIDVEKVILFGNIVNDDGADIDILVVSDDFEDMLIFKREQVVKSLIDSDKTIDPICVTLSEYRRMKATKNYFVSQVLSKGMIIYERRD